MAAMLSDLIGVLQDSYPEASPAEIVGAIKRALDESFTEALKRVEIPPAVSSLQRKLFEYRLQRLPSRSREVQKLQWEQRDLFLEAVWYLKSALDGKAIDTGDFPSPLAGVDSTSLYEKAPAKGRATYDAPSLERPVRVRSWDVTHLGWFEDVNRSTFPPIKGEELERLTERPRIEPAVRLSKVMALKAQEDRVVSILLDRLEHVVDRFKSLTPPKGNVYADWVRDIEWSKWEKIVFELNPREGSFEERLKLWQAFDDALRREFQDAIREAKGKGKVELRRLSENAFVHMQFP